ncbi:MAG: hypothetical protein JWQ96_2412 [Segetibacter sp.]|nr:hypothetical protein [Segetibacter sp.]
MASTHKGTELNNVNETWNENERKRGEVPKSSEQNLLPIPLLP